MVKTISIFTLSLLLSVAILGPCALVFCDDRVEVELVTDFDEETNKCPEQAEKYFKEIDLLSIETQPTQTASVFYYTLTLYNHTRDVLSPPPKRLS